MTRYKPGTVWAMTNAAFFNLSFLDLSNETTNHVNSVNRVKISPRFVDGGELLPKDVTGLTEFTRYKQARRGG